MTTIRLTLCALLLAAALWLDPAFMLAVPLLFMPVFGASCTIFSDDFSTDRTGTDYTTVSGSWAVSAGVLTCTSASALILSNTATDAGATGVYVSATFTLSSTSQIGRLIAAYVDSSNYWYVEVEPGATNGTLKLFEVSGGTTTQRGSTATFTSFGAGDTATVCLSIGGGDVRANAFETSNAYVQYAASPTVASTKAGLGTGSGTTSATFNDFLIGKHHVDDATCKTCQPHCAEGLCNSGTYPTEIHLTISGVTDGPLPQCLTGQCDTMNNTFVCQRVSDCGWQYQRVSPLEPCVMDFFKIDITLSVSSSIGRWDICVAGDTGFGVCTTDRAFASVTFGTPGDVDCSAEQSGTLTSDSTTYESTACKRDGASFVLTPVL